MNKADTTMGKSSDLTHTKASNRIRPVPSHKLKEFNTILESEVNLLKKHVQKLDPRSAAKERAALDRMKAREYAQKHKSSTTTTSANRPNKLVLGSPKGVRKGFLADDTMETPMSPTKRCRSSLLPTAFSPRSGNEVVSLPLLPEVTVSTLDTTTKDDKHTEPPAPLGTADTEANNIDLQGSTIKDSPAPKSHRRRSRYPSAHIVRLLARELKRELAADRTCTRRNTVTYLTGRPTSDGAHIQARRLAFPRHADVDTTEGDLEGLIHLSTASSAAMAANNGSKAVTTGTAVGVGKFHYAPSFAATLTQSPRVNGGATYESAGATADASSSSASGQALSPLSVPSSTTHTAATATASTPPPTACAALFGDVPPPSVTVRRRRVCVSPAPQASELGYTVHLCAPAAQGLDEAEGAGGAREVDEAADGAQSGRASLSNAVLHVDYTGLSPSKGTVKPVAADADADNATDISGEHHGGDAACGAAGGLPFRVLHLEEADDEEEEEGPLLLDARALALDVLVSQARRGSAVRCSLGARGLVAEVEDVSRSERKERLMSGANDEATGVVTPDGAISESDDEWGESTQVFEEAVQAGLAEWLLEGQRGDEDALRLPRVVHGDGAAAVAATGLFSDANAAQTQALECGLRSEELESLRGHNMQLVRDWWLLQQRVRELQQERADERSDERVADVAPAPSRTRGGTYAIDTSQLPSRSRARRVFEQLAGQRAVPASPGSTASAHEMCAVSAVTVECVSVLAAETAPAMRGRTHVTDMVHTARAVVVDGEDVRAVQLAEDIMGVRTCTKETGDMSKSGSRTSDSAITSHTVGGHGSTLGDVIDVATVLGARTPAKATMMLSMMAVNTPLHVRMDHEEDEEDEDDTMDELEPWMFYAHAGIVGWSDLRNAIKGNTGFFTRARNPKE